MGRTRVYRLTSCDIFAARSLFRSASAAPGPLHKPASLSGLPRRHRRGETPSTRHTRKPPIKQHHGRPRRAINALHHPTHRFDDALIKRGICSREQCLLAKGMSEDQVLDTLVAEEELKHEQRRIL